MPETFLSIGSNIGDRLFNLNSAKARIADEIGLIIIESGIYETQPWGFMSSDYFLNMVILVKTKLGHEDLLRSVNMIEADTGRQRIPGEYTSRKLDIDILFYDDLVINEPGLIIPHPKLHLRKFVLIPMNEIAPEKVHPIFFENMRDLVEKCEDRGSVRKF